MKAIVLMLPLLSTSAANASLVNPFAACGVLNFNDPECAQHAAEQCGYTTSPNTADTGCLFRYGYKLKFQMGADHKYHFCRLSARESPATVWDCSGSRG